MNWYDAAYGNDPAMDNVFGEEIRAERRHPVLLEFLRRGGKLGDFARATHEQQARERLVAAMDAALTLMPGSSSPWAG